jgi:hypothetical protein
MRQDRARGVRTAREIGERAAPFHVDEGRPGAQGGGQDLPLLLDAPLERSSVRGPPHGHHDAAPRARDDPGDVPGPEPIRADLDEAAGLG